jgi:hypothetical protein
MKTIKKFLNSLYEAICAARMAQAQEIVKGHRGS